MIADAQLPDVDELRVPVERDVRHAHVAAVGPGDRLHDDGAVLGIAADRAETILRPRQRHHTVAADAAERRTQTGETAARRRTEDRSARLGADAEGRRSRRRCAEEGPADDPLDPCVRFHGFFVCPPNHWSPLASSPVGQLGDQHGAGVAQHLDDARVVVERPGP